MQLLSGCFCGGGDRSGTRNKGSAEQAIRRLSSPQPAEEPEALEDMHAALLSLSGSWIKRLDDMLQEFSDRGVCATLYGAPKPVEDEPPRFAVLASKGVSVVASDALNRCRSEMLCRMSQKRAPIRQQLAAAPSTCAAARAHQNAAQRDIGPSYCLVAAVPLILGNTVIGALWLEELQPPLQPQQQHLHLQQQPRQHSSDGRARTDAGGSHNAVLPCFPLLRQRPTSGASSSASETPSSSNTESASPLLRSELALRQLGLAASAGLAGLGPDSLPWLTGVVSRLRAASSMQALTTQLCTELSYHVRSRFVLDSSTCAALVPPGSRSGIASGSGSGSEGPQLALLIRVQPGAGGEAAAGVNGEGGCRTSRDVDSLTPATDRRCKSASRLKMSFAVQQSGRSAPNLAAMAGLQRAAQPRRSPMTVMLAGAGTAPDGSAEAGSPAPGHIIVALSAADVAAVTSGSSAPPALHASAFPLHRTLLQTFLRELRPGAGPRRVLSGVAGPRRSSGGSRGEALDVGDAVGDCGRGDGGGGSGGAATASGAAGARSDVAVPATVTAVGAAPKPSRAVIESTMSYVRDVKNPSRDVYMLMAPRQGRPAAPHSGGGANGGTCGRGSGGAVVAGVASTAPQSLVLVTVLLDEGAALGLYVCFPRQLPGQLLEAVRDSCQELLDLMLAEPVRDRLRGALHPEYGTIVAAPPGSYAVVRGLSYCDVEITAAVERTGTPQPATSPGPGPGPRIKGLLCTPSTMMSSLLTTVDSDVTTEDCSLGESSEQRGSAWARLLMSYFAASASQNHASCSDRAVRTGGLLTSSLWNVDEAAWREQVPSSGAGGVGGHRAPAEAPCASLITVRRVRSGTGLEGQQLGLLVSSIHASMHEAAAHGPGANSFAGDLDELELVGLLGRGGGGVVLEGLLSSTLPVAVKLLGWPGNNEADGGGSAEAQDRQGERKRRELLRNAMELAVQSSLSHPNIVQLYSTFHDVVLRRRDGGQVRITDMRPGSVFLAAAKKHVHAGANDGPRLTCMLAEYCDGGSLLDALRARTFPQLLRQSRNATPDPDQPFEYDVKGIYMTLLDVALALRHLHSLNLVHRDVKAANLLLKTNPHDYRGFTVKLTDFGIVLHLQETAEDGTRYAVVERPQGTLTHMAPECFAMGVKITASVDVFSFGILMFELVSRGSGLYGGVPRLELPNLITRGARPKFARNVPQLYRSLAHSCWRTDPLRRPRTSDLVTSLSTLLQALPW